MGSLEAPRAAKRAKGQRRSVLGGLCQGAACRNCRASGQRDGSWCAQSAPGLERPRTRAAEEAAALCPARQRVEASSEVELRACAQRGWCAVTRTPSWSRLRPGDDALERILLLLLVLTQVVEPKS